MMQPIDHQRSRLDEHATNGSIAIRGVLAK
jgi:hypothetical protein